jgi:Protein of unknown function (DUF1553)/Protein of unknown function (DUF1549)
MWLDVVRYSDSNGFDWDEFRPNAWRYRDYVIRSLNADKPYDQFIREQLAGDELFDGPPRNVEQQEALLATAFLRLGPHDNAAGLFNEQDRSRDELMIDLVETTGTAFLGMTLSCCRCHDHKHDPLSQADHFRIRACFAGVKFADDLPINLADQQTEIEAHNQAIDNEISQLNQRQEELLAQIRLRCSEERSSKSTVNSESSKGLASDTANSAVVVQEQAAAKTREPTNLNKEQGARSDQFDAARLTIEQLRNLATESEKLQLEQFDTQRKDHQQRKRTFDYAMSMVDTTQPLPETFVLYLGDHKSPRAAVVPGVLSVLDPNPLSVSPPARTGSSGRRLALANWIVSPNNPLTARVMANRIWQNLMGQGLVKTSGDFGLAGAAPHDPAMLDWLSTQFIAEGWSLKQLVRTIVLSSVYQQSATFDEPPENLSYLFRRPRRLTAEQLRDSLLYVSGLMSVKNSGPPQWPELPQEVLEANPAFLDDNETKTKGWYPSPIEDQYCRSIFLVQKRNTRVPLLETFDQPDNSVCCSQRLSSVVAPQALALLNSPEALRAARGFSERIMQPELAEEERIKHGFRLALQRSPTPEELILCQQLLEKTNCLELCRVLLNLNEFAYVD